MFPHERSLVKRLETRPFALIGVNSDSDREFCRKRNLAEGVTWRSFWNGKDGKNGPISRAWNIEGWPTIYLIDHKGVLRRKYLGNPCSDELDRRVEKLIREAEATNGVK